MTYKNMKTSWLDGVYPDENLFLTDSGIRVRNDMVDRIDTLIANEW